MTSKGPKKMGDNGGRWEAGEGEGEVGLLLLMAWERERVRLSLVAVAARGSDVVVLVVESRGSREGASQLPDLRMLVNDLSP